MLYISKNKVYLRVSNKYKEVSITKKGENDYTVKACLLYTSPSPRDCS